jgi:hypothetical protein
MTRLLRFTVVLGLTAPLSLVAGCKQGVGERCQVQSDCDDNLICTLPAGGTPQAGGTCQANVAAPQDLSAAPQDLATPGHD